MSYWTTIPTIIRKTKRLTAEEKELYYELFERANVANYCEPTNAELAKALNVSVNTIQSRIASLKKKGFIGILLKKGSNNLRRIYPRIPGQPSEERKPTDADLNEKTEKFKTALKQALIFGDIAPQVLSERLIESPYLDCIKDNSTQFVLNLHEIEHMINFIRLKKTIDCQIACYRHVNIGEVITAIRQSEFLRLNDNLTVKWCLDHAEEIIKGKYKGVIYRKAEYAIEDNQSRKANFKQRRYAPGELAGYLMSIDEID